MTSSGGAVPIYVDLIANGVSAVTGSVSFKIEPLSVRASVRSPGGFVP